MFSFKANIYALTYLCSSKYNLITTSEFRFLAGYYYYLTNKLIKIFFYSFTLFLQPFQLVEFDIF